MKSDEFIAKIERYIEQYNKDKIIVNSKLEDVMNEIHSFLDFVYQDTIYNKADIVILVESMFEEIKEKVNQYE